MTVPSVAKVSPAFSTITLMLLRAMLGDFDLSAPPYRGADSEHETMMQVCGQLRNMCATTVGLR